MTRRVLCALVALIVGGLLAVAPAYAEVRHVHQGESIQGAIDAAQPGDEVIVHHGTYRESLLIAKDRISLIGKHARLLPPASSDSPCGQDGTFPGICVVGEGNFDTGEISHYASRVRIAGFTVKGFGGEAGIFAFGTDRLLVTRSRLIDDGDYGVFALVSKRPHLIRNLASGNQEAGFYVGDSPDAKSVLRHNVAFGNGEGILLRNTTLGKVSGNLLAGNCAGIIVLADAPGPAGGFLITHNALVRNNKACPGNEEEGEPGLSGLGIGLAGAHDTSVVRNLVKGNRPSGQSFISGGIAVAQGFGGTEPQNDLIRRNRLFGNEPNDLVSDGTGTVSFSKNRCETSDPAGLCGSGPG
jgi:nitrous oxidase accessory protein NosD